VNTLETQITDWDGKNLDEEGDNTWWNDEVAEKLLASVKGRNEKETKSAVNEIGFAGLIAQNIAQIKHFNDLKSTLINPTAITAFNAGKPELKTEIA